MNKQKTKFSPVVLAASVVLVIIIGLCLFVFIRANIRTVANLSDGFLEEVTVGLADLVSMKLEDSVIEVQLAVEPYSQLESYTDENAINMLQKLQDTTAFSKMNFVDAQCTMYDVNGATADVSVRDYWRAGMQGQAGISSPFIGTISDKACIAVYAPVYKDGAVAGMLTGIYFLEDFSNVLQLNVFDGQAFFHLI